MAHLTYYSNERVEFKEEFSKKLPNAKATTIVIRKLLRHYKLGNWKRFEIGFTSGRNYSKAGRWHIIINLDDNNFGTICHEVAHTYQAMKENFERGDHWHTKKHRRIMVRMLNYCKKKNWFEDELNKRLAIKQPKPEPTKDEKREKQIENLEKSNKRHQTKIKRCQTLIKKNNRRISALKRFIKRV
jgi:hypothetical protein